MSRSIEGFGKYLLLERLAAGGMAEVYLAKSTGAAGISRFVAIKRILPQYSENPEFIDMFKEEAKIAVNLNHGNVVSIYEFGIQNSQFFLVMEFVEGQNLRQVLNHMKKSDKHFSIDQIVYVVTEVAAGLDHAHRCIDGTTGRPLNIIHRDMSPQNIMISFEGEIKIIDFGIAKTESQIENTRTGTIKGKFGYMSPEQADGQDVDLRTDIFSLGIVLWELLANERLFTSGSEAATLKKIRECQIPNLRSINPNISPELERICNKALSKDKSLRYQTSSAFHKDLNRFLNTQYPEFSPQDFSVYMKSAFAQTYLENKKKMVEYSKLQAFDAMAAEVTSTITITESEKGESKEKNYADDPMQDSDLFKQEKQIKVNLNDLKIDNSKQRKSAGSNQSQVFRENGPRTNNYNPYPPMEFRRQSFLDSNWVYLVIAAVMVFGVWFFGFRNQMIDDRNLSSQQLGSVELGSKQPLAFAVESYPSGAKIIIDGKDTGLITPARHAIGGNREFRLQLKRDGYQPHESRQIIYSSGQTIRATLKPMPQMGYISVNSPNSGTNPVIAINGQRISEKLPLKMYGVPANIPIRVQIQNPYSQLYAESTVTVGANQKKSLNLILTNNKNRQSRGQ